MALFLKLALPSSIHLLSTTAGDPAIVPEAHSKEASHGGQLELVVLTTPRCRVQWFTDMGRLHCLVVSHDAKSLVPLFCDGKTEFLVGW